MQIRIKSFEVYQLCYLIRYENGRDFPNGAESVSMFNGDLKPEIMSLWK